MQPNNAHLIYFSPTGTTRKTINAITEGLSVKRVHRYDLTYANEMRTQSIDDGVAIIGIPVYAGRVPIDCLARLEGFTARMTPTVLVALYGNREFEDALVELRDVVVIKGFHVIAAGAFIGEHSYSTPKRPIAAGRPDIDDIKFAQEFGRQVAEKLAGEDFSLPEIDGNIPYRERVKFGGISPETSAKTCTLCGKCAEVCPVCVIEVSESVVTHAGGCIMCAACTRICDVDARHFDHPTIEEKRTLLNKNCAVPKLPKVFL